MTHDPSSTPPLGEFMDLRELQAEVAKTFPSIDSLRWFVRRHRAKLVAGGAIIAIAGRLRFHPQRFSDVAVAIGNDGARLDG